jgi:hypothetical protein
VEWIGMVMDGLGVRPTRVCVCVCGWVCRMTISRRRDHAISMTMRPKKDRLDLCRSLAPFDEEDLFLFCFLIWHVCVCFLPTSHRAMSRPKLSIQPPEWP